MRLYRIKREDSGWETNSETEVMAVFLINVGVSVADHKKHRQEWIMQESSVCASRNSGPK